MEKLKELCFDPFTKLLKKPVHLLKSGTFDFARKRSDPGASPGIEGRKDIKQPPAPGEIPVSCIHYSETELIQKKYDSIDDFLTAEEHGSDCYRWLNIDGLNPYVVNRLREHFNLHTLAAEDTLNVPQRPKIENYEGHIYIVMRMLMLRDNSIINEQVSLFHLGKTLITVQEASGDVWDKVRKRISRPDSRFRKLGSDYLLYALVDAIIDHIFPSLEDYGDFLDELEQQVLKNPTPTQKQHIYRIRGELSIYRRIVAPTREMLHALHQDREEIFNDLVEPFFRDVHDHAQQLLDTIDNYREMANGLSELYHATITEKLNETMKVLTMLASFFIPITFFAGVYGMNFEHIPELKWQYAYPTFWTICSIVATCMWFFFRKKGWLGK